MEGGTVLGNRAGIAEADPVRERIRQKRKGQPFIPGDFCGESRYQCQHSEPDRGRAIGNVRGDFRKAVEVLDTDADELLGRRAKEKENDPVETTAARIPAAETKRTEDCDPDYESPKGRDGGKG